VNALIRTKKHGRGRYISLPVSFFIERLLEDTSQGTHALARHESYSFEVELIGAKERLRGIVGTTVNCELDVLEVKEWRVLERDELDAHGLFPLSGRTVKFIGSVMNVIEMEDDRCVMDLYSRTGPEYLALDSIEVGLTRWSIGTPVELIIEGLHCFPTWT
jgi:hypothetical protein